MSKTCDFRVRCTKRCNDETTFTIGKVYRVKNGVITSDEGFKFNAWSIYGSTFENLKNWFKNYYTFELVSNQNIKITTDGKTTTAQFYEDGKLINEACSKCSPEDEFNFGTGANIALQRLLEDMDNSKGDKVIIGKPLTTDELKKLHNRCVWLSSLDDNKKEEFKGSLCDWYIVDVKNNKLVNLKTNSYYNLNSNDTYFGFRAYLTAPEFIK